MANFADPAGHAQAKRHAWSFLHGMRMRLTLGFVGFFSLLMLAAGLFFRDSLEIVLRQHASEHLLEEWNSIRMHLHIDNGTPTWLKDRTDSEEVFAIERMRRILLLTDSEGRVLESSTAYRAIGEESDPVRRAAMRSPRPVLAERTGPRGERYLVRMGLFRFAGQDYFLSIGTPITATDEVLVRRVRLYFYLLPFMLLLVSAAGWYLAGRALKPMNDVAEASAIVSADNLKLRITPPGTRDELDHLVHRFNEMMDRLEQNFEQIRQFTINASHELRTPVTGIRGQLEVALLHARSVDEFRDAVETAMQDVERLSQIVKTLMLLSQADSGKLQLQKGLHDLTELLRSVIYPYELNAAEKNMKFTSVLPDSCPAMVDRGQFERLASNLISNAITHTPAGGAVQVTLSRKGGNVCLAVADNGPGIPAIHLPHIFDRFYRVRDGEREEQKGLGLGLSVALWIARAHGGNIEVKSEPGQGATFIVEFPAGLPDGTLPVLVTTQKQPA